jgi:hypothetical protein
MINLPITRSYVAKYLTSFTKFTSNLVDMKLIYFEHWNVLLHLTSMLCENNDHKCVYDMNMIMNELTTLSIGIVMLFEENQNAWVFLFVRAKTFMHTKRKRKCVILTFVFENVDVLVKYVDCHKLSKLINILYHFTFDYWVF